MCGVFLYQVLYQVLIIKCFCFKMKTPEIYFAMIKTQFTILIEGYTVDTRT